VGNNQAYYKTTVSDSVTTQGGPQFDPAHPVNNSPNNTGLTALPPARGAYIWYPYGPSTDFPIVGTGGRTAEAGPVFYRDDFRNAARPFPQYYDGKLFIYEFMRHWIMAVSMDKSGDLLSIEQFMRAPRSARRSRWNSRRAEICTSSSTAHCGSRATTMHGSCASSTTRAIASRSSQRGRSPEGRAATAYRIVLSGHGGSRRGFAAVRMDDRAKGGAVLRRLSEPNPSFTLREPGRTRRR